MDELVGGSGDVASDPGDMDVSTHEVSLMSKSQLRAGLTHRLSLNSSQDTWLPVSDMKSTPTQHHYHFPPLFTSLVNSYIKLGWVPQNMTSGDTLVRFFCSPNALHVTPKHAILMAYFIMNLIFFL